MGRVIEVLANGRVHVSVGREQWRDIIVMHPAHIRIEVTIGQRIWVFDADGNSTERYGLPMALHGDTFSSGPGDLVALQSQIDHLDSQFAKHIHSTPAGPSGAPTVGTPPKPPASPPPGAQKVRVE